jgi:predicted membrane protein
LDNLRDPSGFVVVGIGNLLHRRRADSHSVGCCVSDNGIPSDSGTQDPWLDAASFPRLGSGLLLNVFGEYKDMPLVNIVVALIVVGLALWLINNFIPMASSIKTILNVVVVVAVAVWVLQAVGMWGRVTSYKFVN